MVVVMGVAGSGKTTVGELLAARNGGEFYDADDFHPPANIAKMASSIPLDDDDRAPWLARLREEVIDRTEAGALAVLACSALKKAYREQLGVGKRGVALAYLRGNPATLAERLASRSGHYMKAGMLASQLAVLEEPLPDEGITVVIDGSVGEIVTAIESSLGFRA